MFLHNRGTAGSVQWKQCQQVWLCINCQHKQELMIASRSENAQQQTFVVTETQLIHCVPTCHHVE